MKIKRFEDIEAWKKSRSLTKEIYKVTALGDFSKDWGLEDQIRRSSVSVMSNIAEGFDSFSKIEFARFSNISRRSISETQRQLYVALDQNYIRGDLFDRLYKEGEEIRKMITGFMKYLKFFNNSLTR